MWRKIYPTKTCGSLCGQNCLWGSHFKEIYRDCLSNRTDKGCADSVGMDYYVLLPAAFNNYFCRTTVIYSHLTRNSNLCYKPFAHTNTRLFSVKYNETPLTIKHLPNMCLFKSGLRCFIICLKCMDPSFSFSSNATIISYSSVSLTQARESHLFF